MDFSSKADACGIYGALPELNLVVNTTTLTPDERDFFIALAPQEFKDPHALEGVVQRIRGTKPMRKRGRKSRDRTNGYGKGHTSTERSTYSGIEPPPQSASHHVKQSTVQNHSGRPVLKEHFAEGERFDALHATEPCVMRSSSRIKERRESMDKLHHEMAKNSTSEHLRSGYRRTSPFWNQNCQDEALVEPQSAVNDNNWSLAFQIEDFVHRNMIQPSVQ
jgi:hypothetical protein